MKKKTISESLLACALVAACLVADSALCEDAVSDASDGSLIVVVSDSFSYDMTARLARFIGNVVVTELSAGSSGASVATKDEGSDSTAPAAETNGILRCESLLIELEENEGDGPSKSSTSLKPKSFTADGNVFFEQYGPGNTVEVTGKGGSLFYNAVENKMVFSDNPLLFQGKNEMRGDIITVFLKESKEGEKRGSQVDRILCEPNAIIRLYDSSGGEMPSLF